MVNIPNECGICLNKNEGLKFMVVLYATGRSI